MKKYPFRYPSIIAMCPYLPTAIKLQSMILFSPVPIISPDEAAQYRAELALVAELDDEVVGHVMISGAVVRHAAGERPIVMSG